MIFRLSLINQNMLNPPPPVRKKENCHPSPPFVRKKSEIGGPPPLLGER